MLRTFHRRNAIELGILASPVVERSDLAENVAFGRRPRTVTGAKCPATPETTEEAFGGSVVHLVSIAALRADQVILVLPRLKGVAGILDPRGGVMNQARRRFPAKQSYFPHIDHDALCHSWLDLPADTFAVEQIENDGQIEPICRDGMRLLLNDGK